MKRSLLKLVGLFTIMFLSANGRAASMVETFDNGLSSTLWTTRQTYTHNGIATVYPTGPWTVVAPDPQGRLQLYKPTDSDQSTANCAVEQDIKSKFTLDGDFSVSTDFDFEIFQNPDRGYDNVWFWVEMGPNTGWRVTRFTPDLVQTAGGANGNGNLNNVSGDSTMVGRFKITRIGNTMSGFIDRGSGFVCLGSSTDPGFAGPANVHFGVGKGSQEARTFDAMDIRFDNLNIMADTITIPEPLTLSLLGIGTLALLRRQRI